MNVIITVVLGDSMEDNSAGTAEVMIILQYTLSEYANANMTSTKFTQETTGNAVLITGCNNIPKSFLTFDILSENI